MLVIGNDKLARRLILNRKLIRKNTTLMSVTVTLHNSKIIHNRKKLYACYCNIKFLTL